MSEWKECKLGDIAIITDCEHKTAPLVDSSEFISVRTSNIQNGKIDFDNSNRVSSEVYEEWTKRLKPKFGDIVLAREAPVGEVGWIPKGKKVCLGQRTVLIRTINESINTKYLLYYLVNKEVKYDLINKSTGSVVEHLNVKDIKNFDLKIPNLLEEQCTIASILSSLDDKIDLLHRQNATLEKMAETLFRQWFVEEAKEDWKMGTIADLSSHLKRSIQPQKYPKTKFIHYSIPSFDNGKNPIVELGIDIQSNKYIIPDNCILFSKLNPHKDKRVWLLQNEVLENSICSTEFQIINPKDKKLLYFLYGWLSLNENYNEIASGIGGTSGSHQRIDPNTIFDFQCPLIAESVIENFKIEIEPLFKKQLINQNQIRTLTALRDTLLPKLMSGEVRVNN